MKSVVCVGETMGQIVPTGGSLRTAIGFRMNHAGAESNTAVILSRLGVDVEWISRLGADPVGDRILDALRAERVAVDHVARDAERTTGLFLKDPAGESRRVIYYRRESAASQLSARDINRALALKPQVLHLTGITPALSESCYAAVDYALTSSADLPTVVAFDVNYRPALWPDQATASARLRKLANKADVVFVGRDEATSLWGTDTAGDVRDALRGPTTLIVKDAERNATEFGNGYTTVVPALEVEVVESVGAGDAFAAGWIAGHLAGDDPVTRLRLGHLAARRALTALDDQGEAASLDQLRAELNSMRAWHFDLLSEG